MKDTKEKVWAYIDDELSKEDREALERELESNPELQQELKSRQVTNRLLAENLPIMEITGKIPAEEIEALINEFDTEHPQYMDKPVSRAKIIRYSIPLAAAAAATFLFMPLLNRGPVAWERTRYGTAPKMRDDTVSGSYYNRSGLKQIANQLQANIESNLPSQPKSAPKWKLQIHLQELTGGALRIEVTELSPRTKHWQLDLTNLSEAEARIPEFGKQIVAELGASSRE